VLPGQARQARQDSSGFPGEHQWIDNTPLLRAPGGVSAWRAQLDPDCQTGQSARVPESTLAPELF
jgi:hypothetical protein